MHGSIIQLRYTANEPHAGVRCWRKGGPRLLLCAALSRLSCLRFSARRIRASRGVHVPSAATTPCSGMRANSIETPTFFFIFPLLLLLLLLSGSLNSFRLRIGLRRARQAGKQGERT